MENIRAAGEEAQSAAGVSAEDIALVQYGLAGADREKDFAMLRLELSKLPWKSWNVVCDTINLITSIYNNRKDVQTVNVRNGGILPFLPDDASIEANYVIDSDGAHPLRIDTPISPKIRGLIQVVKAYEELTVEAAVNGDYGLAWQALTIHPLVTSSSVARKILDAIIEQNREYLPQFR